MYSTEGIDAIATITELRSNTSELLEHIREHKTSVLIQKNNEAYAVLMDWETYKDLVQSARAGGGKPLERSARRKGGKRGPGDVAPDA